jgi:hypothetical protein
MGRPYGGTLAVGRSLAGDEEGDAGPGDPCRSPLGCGAFAVVLALTAEQPAEQRGQQQPHGARRLSLGERLGVRLHMMVCKACPRFAQQVTLMRRALNCWKADAES